jgi:hypothetical protein
MIKVGPLQSSEINTLALVKVLEKLRFEAGRALPM